jgi:hypothetical protein
MEITADAPTYITFARSLQITVEATKKRGINKEEPLPHNQSFSPTWTN